MQIGPALHRLMAQISVGQFVQIIVQPVITAGAKEGMLSLQVGVRVELHPEPLFHFPEI